VRVRPDDPGKAPSRAASGRKAPSETTSGRKAPSTTASGRKATVRKAKVRKAKPRLAKHKLLKTPKARPPHKPKVAKRASVQPDPARATEIYARLSRAYPDAHCALDHRNAFELLVATILSAQCTDKRVNMVTPALFARYPDASALAAARQEDVEELIRSAGFFRTKAKNIIAMSNALVERHGGEVPREMEALVTLPGVGRKTANVILGNAFDMNEGIVVDTHVSRLSNRLGFVAEDDPVKIEQALIPLFPRENWTMLSHLLIEHGRQICDARKPLCGECVVRELCPSALV
jgi:endonuclease-3